MGIYGFLSAAYQETAAKAGNIEAQISLVEVKRDNIKEQLVVYNEEKSSINSAVASLRNGLSTNKIQYTDTAGNVLTTTSSSTRRALEKQLDQAIDRQTTINTRVDGLNEELFNYETEIVEIKMNDSVAGELGPLKYLSGLTGTPMDKIINWLLLTIIFVFDPLAIALVIAANYAFEQIKPKTRENLYGETVPEEKIIEVLKEDEYAVDGYMEAPQLTPTPPKPTITEQEAIEKILNRKLTQWEVKDLTESKEVQIFNNPKNNDDLKITY
jgi:hypothetical protein